MIVHLVPRLYASRGYHMYELILGNQKAAASHISEAAPLSIDGIIAERLR